MSELSITPDRTVGEIVAARPTLARVFERLGIDYCCGGKRTLAAVCASTGLEVTTVIQLLTEMGQGPEMRPAIDPTALTLTELADHIEHTHHAYLKTQLPAMLEKADRVAQKHSWRDPLLVDVAQTLRAFSNEMFSHMEKEEHMLFPMVRELEQGNGAATDHCGTIENPISVMEHEHDSAGDAMRFLRKLTRGFQPTEECCNTHRALLADLAELERDLHEHVHKENNILFPRALELERRVIGPAAQAE